MIADRTLCLDKTATRLVPEGSTESAYQLVNAGREIPSDEVARLGLVVVDGRVEQTQAQADGDAGSEVEEARTNVIDGPGSDFPNASWESSPESPGESEG